MMARFGYELPPLKLAALDNQTFFDVFNSSSEQHDDSGARTLNFWAHYEPSYVEMLVAANLDACAPLPAC